MSIIQRIYTELEKQGKKAADLGRAVGLSSAQMSAWKTRDTDPPAKLLPMICEYLGVSMEYLITGTDGALQIEPKPVVTVDREPETEEGQISDRIFCTLKEKGHSQSDLARALGVQTGQVSNWKIRRSVPAAKYIIAISKYLGVSVEYLLSGNEDTEIEPQHFNAMGAAVALDEMESQLILLRSNDALTTRIREVAEKTYLDMTTKKDIT